MKKKLFFAAIALTTLAGCTDESYVGDQSLLTNDGGAISFNMGTPNVTRSVDAPTALHNQFVVFGYKDMPTGTPPQTVFDNYQVNYAANTANTTESNSANWEYVSYKNLPFGTTTDGTTSPIVLNTNGVSSNATATGIDQSIKYWDFSATKYNFFAYSLGTGSSSTYAKASAMDNNGYSLEGTAAQLGTCYISKKESFAPSTSATEVELKFLSFLSKVELKFYETIPGYSIKDVKFYPTASSTVGDAPYLYASSEALPTEGKYNITFDASTGKPELELASSSPTPTKAVNISFGTSLSNYRAAEYQEDNTSAIYLGRNTTETTSSDIITVLPNPSNTNALNLKMDFTLVSRDKTGEEIVCTGATAVIPAVYAQWKPNYKYTYIFKISDNTNAQSGTITGLYPITLDAVVTDTEDGTQETITTVSDPSITTYAKASNVLADNEYKSGSNIYIVVNNGVALTVNTNAKLYTAEIEAGAAQDITEETVKNAIANGSAGYDAGTILVAGTLLDGYYTESSGSYTACTTGNYADGTTKYYKPATKVVTDANGKKLAVKDVSTSLTATNSIDGTDSPDGKVISVNVAKFTPATPTYTRIPDGTSLPAGTYYTDVNGTTATISATTTTSSDNYYYKTSNAGYYVFEFTGDSDKKYYKVIKVVD